MGLKTLPARSGELLLEIILRRREVRSTGQQLPQSIRKHPSEVVRFEVTGDTQPTSNPPGKFL
jgi:hypothetical protein